MNNNYNQNQNGYNQDTNQAPPSYNPNGYQAPPSYNPNGYQAPPSYNPNGYQAPPSYNPNPYQAPSYNYNYDNNYAQQTAPASPEVNELASSSLTRGIVALILAEIPIVSIVAIILGFSAKGKGQKAQNLAKQLYCKCPAKAIVGRILGIVGGIYGIFMTVFWPIYIIYMIYIFGFLGNSYYL